MRGFAISAPIMAGMMAVALPALVGGAVPFHERLRQWVPVLRPVQPLPHPSSRRKPGPINTVLSGYAEDMGPGFRRDDGGRVEAARPKPMRVMSINQCTDQILLALLPPDRIVSVSWLSRDAQASLMAREAARVGINHGLAEEVLRQQPDLVLAGTGARPATRAFLKRLGYPLVEVDDAYDFDQIRTVTRRIAAAVGEEARGEALIARMDRRLARLARETGPPIRVAAWGGDGFGAPAGSLYDTLLSTAGATNIANQPAIAGYGAANVEVLLAAAPDLLVLGAPTAEGPALRDAVTGHPLVRRYWGHGRSVTVRQADYLCGTPQIADAAVALRGRLRRTAAAARTPLPFAGRRMR